MKAPIPENEKARLMALRECRVLDTAPEGAFDDLTRLAMQICGVPIAAVTLIDAERQWFKSIFGLAATETHRDFAFCSHTILQTGVLEVPDVAADERFSSNPFVTGHPHVRFYAGAPLIDSEGYALGALCVIDDVPRQLSADQKSALAMLARQVSSQLETARRLVFQENLMAERAATDAERRRLAAIVESSADAIISIDLAGQILTWNGGAERLFGFSAAEMIGGSETPLLPPGETGFHSASLTAVLEHGRLENLIVVRRRKCGALVHVCWTLSLIHNATGRPVGMSAVGRDTTEKRLAETAVRESEAKFRSIIDASPVPYALNDAHQNITFLNVEFVRTFGYTLEDIPTLADWWPQAYPDPEYRRWVAAAWQARMERATATRTAFEPLELTVRCKDGMDRIVMVSAAALGESLGGTHLVILYDVTERKWAQEETARMAAILESSHNAVLGMTLDGTVVSWNAAAEQLYGYSEAEIVGLHASQLVPPQERGFVATTIQAVLRGERRENVEVRRRRKDGAWFDAALTFSPIRNAAGEIVGIGAIGRDITAQKQVQEALRRSEEALRTVMEGAPIVFYATDSAGVVTFSEGAGLERLDLAPGQAVGRSIFGLFGDAPEIVSSLRRALAGEVVFFDSQINDLCYHNEVSPQRDQAGAITGLIGVGHDVTERKQAEETLHEFSVLLEFQMHELEKANTELAMLARLDGLTGLQNRRAFDERIAEEFERTRRYHTPLSLLLLDIDFFKEYNDAFGHPAGDEVLRLLGRVLQKATRDTDFLTRYGGEEMAIILPETDGEGAAQAAERVRLAIATADWPQREITASIGICTLGPDMACPEEMVFCADQALYQSKASGRNRVTHSHSVHSQTRCQTDAASPLLAASQTRSPL